MNIHPKVVPVAEYHEKIGTVNAKRAMEHYALLSSLLEQSGLFGNGKMASPIAPPELESHFFFGPEGLRRDGYVAFIQENYEDHSHSFASWGATKEEALERFSRSTSEIAQHMREKHGVEITIAPLELRAGEKVEAATAVEKKAKRTKRA